MIDQKEGAPECNAPNAPTCYGETDVMILAFIVHAEAFRADRTLVNPLPFNVSDHCCRSCWFSCDANCRQARALQRRQSRRRFLPAAAAADSESPDTETNDVLYVRITFVRLFQADFIGALDNCWLIVEPTPRYAGSG